MAISRGTFKRYRNRVFIETGSYVGDGIQEALDSGFEEVHSIELSEHYYNLASTRFKVNNNVHVHLGDSSTVLLRILSNIDESVTFWLDGHYSAGQTAKGDVSCPLMYELEQISQHRVKNHIIMIDDLRLWNISDPEIGFGIDEIKQKILAINPKYHFLCEDGYIENDVLVAMIKEE